MNQVNFLPQSFILAQQRQQRIFRQVSLLVLVGLAMLGWYLLSRGGLGDLESYAQTLQEQVDAAKRQVDEMSKLKSQHKNLTHQLRIQRELAQPLGHTEIIATLSRIMPETMTITNLAMVVERPEATESREASPRRARPATTPAKAPAKTAQPPHYLAIQLVGLAPKDEDIANFIGHLTTHPIFENVKLLYTRSTQIEKLPAREFRVEMRVPFDRDYQPLSENTVAQESQRGEKPEVEGEIHSALSRTPDPLPEAGHAH